MPLTHYEVLGLTPAAGSEEIKRAYRHQALKWHPDRNPGNEKAHRRFIAIRAAFEVLSDPQRRSDYDVVLRYRAQAKTGYTAPPPPRPHYTPPPSQQYTPPPEYRWRRTYRERPQPKRRFSGVGIFVLAMILFQVMRNCGTRERTFSPEPAGNWMFRRDSVQLDSATKAFFDNDSGVHPSPYYSTDTISPGISMDTISPGV